MTDKTKEILKSVLLDFSKVDPKVLERGIEDPKDIEEALANFYFRVSISSSKDGNLCNFLANYKFPDSFLEISLVEETSISIRPQVFFINPMCYGKIKSFKTFVKLFSHDPNKFYHVYQQYPHLFEYKPPKSVGEVDYEALSSAQMDKCSTEVLQFYEEYIIKPIVKVTNTDYGNYVLIKALVNNHTPAEIILRNVSYENIVQFLKEERLSKAYVHFVKNLNREFVDYLEKNVAPNLKCDLNYYFPSILLTCPSLSPEHKNLYKKALNHFIINAQKIIEKLEEFPGIVETPIEIPESAAEVFNRREAFYILERALYYQKTYINLPYKAFQRKAFMFVMKNVNYTKEFQNTTKAYQDLENPLNAKTAKIMFYEFCLKKMEKYKKPESVLREIYLTFIKYGEDLTTQLLQEFLYVTRCGSKLSYYNLHKQIFAAKVSIPSRESTFAKYAEIIINTLKEEENTNENNRGISQ